MEHLNHTLFLWLNAPEHPGLLMLALAKFFDEYAIFVVPLLLHRSQRMTAVALALLGLPMAWARIYLGVHFPLDMLGAALVAGFSAWLALIGARLYMEPLYRLAIAIHRTLFGALIKRGWVGK